MKKRSFVTMVMLLLIFPSISAATNFLYQASGTVDYWLNGNSGTSEIWGSAIMSDEVAGTTNIDLPYNPEWASNYVFWYEDTNFAFGFDFGGIAGDNLIFQSEHFICRAKAMPSRRKC